jgi:hypothetical protein
MSKRLYVPVTQFYLNEELRYAYGTLGRAFCTYGKARQFPLAGGWKVTTFPYKVFDEVVEFYTEANGNQARIDEVTLDGIPAYT